MARKSSKNKIIVFLVILVIALALVAGVGWVWLLKSVEVLKEEREVKISDASIALDSILRQNPQNSMAHDEHVGLVLTNGDVVEFSKDTSISGDDVVIAINVAALEPGVINFQNVPLCPPPDQEMENEKFCFIPGDILAQAEPHLADVYPEGVLLRSYNTN